jgi:recombination protein RecR
MKLPTPIQESIDELSKLPGLGPKTALRYAMNLLDKGEESINALCESLQNLKQMKKCSECFSYMEESSEGFLCHLCLDETRQTSSMICVVENFKDLMAIERTSKYDGLFHVLGGVLNPLLGIGPNDLNIQSLEKRIKEKNIEHVVLALNPSIEGDATCSFLHDQLKSYCQVDRIGFGIPMGGNLEYLDNQTILTALANRKSMNAVGSKGF